MADRMIARWTSRSGRHWVALRQFPDGGGYHLESPSMGGVFYADSTEAAIRETQRRVDLGLFQPDANTTPMHCVVIPRPQPSGVSG